MYGRKVKLRFFFILLIITTLALSVFLLVKSLEENVIFFKSPTEIKTLSEIGKKKINNEVADSVWGFLTVYLLTFLVGSFVLMGQGKDTETAFSAIAACLNNLGPGLGEVAYNYAGMDAFTKVLLAFVMILGRLEIYTLLVLFTAFFWKE